MEQESEEKNRETSEIIVECNNKIEKLENGCNSSEITKSNVTPDVTTYSNNDTNSQSNIEHMDITVENISNVTIINNTEFVIPHNKSLSLLTQYSSTSEEEDSDNCINNKDIPQIKIPINTKSSSESSDSSEDEEFMKRVGPILEAIKKNEAPTNEESLSDDDDDEINNKQKNVSYGPKVRGEIGINELPPIEDLQITVPETECTELGKITSIVDQMVLIEAIPGTVPLDLDTVLFLENGKRSLGKIFDVLGQVNSPLYCVRFNSTKEIENKEIAIGTQVYCAPRTEYTSFVILSNLMKTKGTDASWEHDVEADPKHVDYSDDEEERAANKAKKMSNKKETDEPKQKQNVQYNRTDTRRGGGGYAGYSGTRPQRYNQPQTRHHRLPNAYPNPAYPQYFGIPPPVCFAYPPPIQYPPGYYGANGQPSHRPPIPSQQRFNAQQRQQHQPPPPGEY